jgi:dimethylargininase
MMLTALTRPVSPSLNDCDLAFHTRNLIDVTLAARQHDAYCDLLRDLGAGVRPLPAAPELPDAVFVEDAAVVVDELAVITAPYMLARRREVPSVAAALAEFRPLRYLEGMATLEGGDVLRIGRTLYVGRSQRTNDEGIRQLAAALAPHSYTVVPIEMRDCLHLKSAVTAVGHGTVLANPDWLDLEPFAQYEVIRIAPEEPGAANAVLVGDAVILPASYPRTRALLENRGIPVYCVDVSELQKAEGAVTCCSILFDASS